MKIRNFEKKYDKSLHRKRLFAKNMFFGYKKYQKWGCHGQKSEFFSNAHVYSRRQDFLVSFIFSISGFVSLESRLIDFGGGGGTNAYLWFVWPIRALGRSHQRKNKIESMISNPARVFKRMVQH